MRFAGHLVLIAIVVPLTARGDDSKKDEYKLRDEARLAIADAINNNDAKAFATYIDKQLELSAMWFDTASCRKQFSDAKVKARELPALVACLSPLGIDAKTMLVRYGPDVIVTLGLKFANGKITLESLKGDGMLGTTAYPHVWIDSFEKHRKAGTKTIAFDANARAEIEDTGDVGVVFEVCVNDKGTVATTKVAMVAANGATAKAVRAGVKAWRFEPFIVRGKPAMACTMESAKLAP